MGYFFTLISIFFNYLLGAVSMHLVLSLSGIIFLGIPTVVKVSMYALAISQRSGIAPEHAFWIASAFSLFTGVLMAWLFVKVSFDSFVVLGLASILAVEALTKSWDSFTNGVLGISGIMRPEIIKELGFYALSMAIIGSAALIIEFILLKTWIGRSLRAYREDLITLESMGMPTSRLGQAIIVVSGFLLSLTGIYYVWRIQFLDPSAANVYYLVEMLTLGIIALKPQLRYVVLGAIFVPLVPEILRAFDFPSEILGHIRLLIYAVMLIILLTKLSSTFTQPRRSI